MKKELFGRLPNGQDVHLYTLSNGALTLSVLDYGCRIQSLLFGGKDVVCGFDSLDGSLADDSYQGSFVRTPKDSFWWYKRVIASNGECLD
jgi:galactose mutarotase-like enzyme